MSLSALRSPTYSRAARIISWRAIVTPKSRPNVMGNVSRCDQSNDRREPTRQEPPRGETRLRTHQLPQFDNFTNPSRLVRRPIHAGSTPAWLTLSRHRPRQRPATRRMIPLVSVSTTHTSRWSHRRPTKVVSRFPVTQRQRQLVRSAPCCWSQSTPHPLSVRGSNRSHCAQTPRDTTVEATSS